MFILLFLALLLAGCGSTPSADTSSAAAEVPVSHAGAAASPLPYALPHVFVGGSSDGATSHGSLTTDGTTLYGRTYNGGSLGLGVVFSMLPDGSKFRILRSFSGKSDGANPRHDAMVLDGDTLYGTTLMGGHNDVGVLFKMKTDGSDYSLLQVFGGGKHTGNTPHSCPRLLGSDLYGMTEKGGEHDEGVIYKIHQSGKDFKLLHSFHSPEGKAPHGAVLILDNALYGMTREGGSANLGVVFQYDLNSGSYTVMHTFKGGATDGAGPFHGNLITDGTWFYGLTHNGGTADKGVLFRLDRSDNFTILHSFGVAGSGDGAEPQGSLTLVGRTVYGTTAKGGSSNQGTFFSLSLDGGAYTTLHDFAGGATDLATNNDNVVFIGSTAYGMPQEGGHQNLGGVFSQQVP